MKKAGICAALLAALVITLSGCESRGYREALALYNAEEYAAALEGFRQLDGYKNSGELAVECEYRLAREIYDSGNYASAIQALDRLEGYKDSAELSAKAADYILEARLPGTWVCEQDVTESFMELLEGQLEGEILQYMEFEPMVLRAELECYPDGTFDIRPEQESTELFFSEGKAAAAEGLLAYYTDELEKVAADNHITLERLLELFEVETPAQVLEAQLGMTMEQYMDRLLPQSGFETIVSAFRASGAYRAEEGAIQFHVSGTVIPAQYDEAKESMTLMDPDGQLTFIRTQREPD